MALRETFDQMINRFGATRQGVWTVKHLAAPLQRWIYRLTGGRMLGLGKRNQNVLLLTTTGRRSGKERTTPVFFLQDENRLILCNVNPGDEPANPWVLNLRANPAAKIQIGSISRTVQAREASESEISRFWPQLLQIWPAYGAHFQKGGRRAIFILQETDQKNAP